MTINIPSFISEHSENTQMYRTEQFLAGVQQEFANRVPVKRILNIDRNTEKST